eukprot:CAMPEP_0115321618 /NCGR_PEP_ID=MMETSP0270-20121206/80963_1 /TAXON_ID=71861 /ORGANISM="Scrippsiella trochoidea, Strain CCMP3099" /LENGTH=129 /DNA_ID=CAMNT_0002741525 /DNA_START=288 /DNA_END=677 /DNA_ORIENTATION=+
MALAEMHPKTWSVGHHALEPGNLGGDLSDPAAPMRHCRGHPGLRPRCTHSPCDGRPPSSWPLPPPPLRSTSANVATTHRIGSGRFSSINGKQRQGAAAMPTSGPSSGGTKSMGLNQGFCMRPAWCFKHL